MSFLTKELLLGSGSLCLLLISCCYLLVIRIGFPCVRFTPSPSSSHPESNLGPPDSETGLSPTRLIPRVRVPFVCFRSPAAPCPWTSVPGPPPWVPLYHIHMYIYIYIYIYTHYTTIDYTSRGSPSPRSARPPPASGRGWPHNIQPYI